MNEDELIDFTNVPSSIPAEDFMNGIDPLPKGFRIQIAPGTLLVTVPHLSRMFLFDTLGRIVRTRDASAGEIRIEGLTAGNYILIVEGKLAQKITIP